MAREVKAFMDAIESATGRIPVWLPGTDVSLGDIGIFEDGQWIQKTSLKDEGIPFLIHEDTTPSEGLDLAHGENWSVSAGGSGGVKVPGGPSGHGALKLSLSGEGSFVLRTSDSLVHKIRNLNEVEGEMIGRYQDEDGSWDKNWCVVSEVFVPSRAFVAVANGGAAELELDLGVQPAGAVLNLAEAKVGAHIGRTSYVSGKSLALTPAVLTFGVRRVDRDRATGRRYVEAPVIVRDVTTDGDMNWKGDAEPSSVET